MIAEAQSKLGEELGVAHLIKESSTIGIKNVLDCSVVERAVINAEAP
jgi:hypothetical protein